MSEKQQEEEEHEKELEHEDVQWWYLMWCWCCWALTANNASKEELSRMRMSTIHILTACSAPHH